MIINYRNCTVPLKTRTYSFCLYSTSINQPLFLLPTYAFHRRWNTVYIWMCFSNCVIRMACETWRCLDSAKTRLNIAELYSGTTDNSCPPSAAQNKLLCKMILSILD